METYPTIRNIISDTPIIAFDKIDGSNIRAEWTRKSGFNKFGSRTRLLGPDERPLGEAIELFMNTYADDLDAIYRKQRFEKTTSFVEYAGPSSFAGYHEENEEHTVTLFDVHLYKKGMMSAKDFLKLFEDVVPIPVVLYEGKANEEFIRSVKESTLDGMTFEGVVCKGGFDARKRPIVFKIKSQAWLDALKGRFDEDMYERLK